MTTVRETRERERSSREAFGKHFYELAKYTYAGVVVGGVMSITDTTHIFAMIYLIAAGIVMTIVFTITGKRILK